MSQRPVVAITGASRGIGHATAQVFGEHGYDVVMLARRGDVLADAATSVPNAVPIATDISDPDSARAAFGQVREQLGRLDVLINNAAVARLHTLEKASDDDLIGEIGTNVLGPMYCTRAAIPLLRASACGHVVNISSESTRDPYPMLIVYATTKGALETLTTGLARELQRDGIKVTLFEVGRTAETGFGEDWDPEETARALERWAEEGYLGRTSADFMSPREVAESIHWVTTVPGSSNAHVVALHGHGLPAS